MPARGTDQDTPPEPMPGTPEHDAWVIATKSQTADREIEFEIGADEDVSTAPDDDFLRMGNLGADADTEAVDEPEDEPEEDVIEILVPKSETKRWVFGPEGQQMELLQRPMSFIMKMQWFALVGEMLDKAMSGKNPLSLADLMDTPGARATEDVKKLRQTGKVTPIRKNQPMNMDSLRDADTFVRAIGKLVMHAPSFLIDSYVIWLDVPSEDRELVREILSLREEDGGPTDEDGIEMIEIFIDQNWDALTRFFEGLGTIQKRVASQQETKRRKA